MLVAASLVQHTTTPVLRPRTTTCLTAASFLGSTDNPRVLPQPPPGRLKQTSPVTTWWWWPHNNSTTAVALHSPQLSTFWRFDGSSAEAPS